MPRGFSRLSKSSTPDKPTCFPGKIRTLGSMSGKCEMCHSCFHGLGTRKVASEAGFKTVEIAVMVLSDCRNPVPGGTSRPMKA